MKIYQIQPAIVLKNRRSERTSFLHCRPSDRLFLSSRRFRGQPFPTVWRRVELNFADRAPCPWDFYFFGPGALVCSRRAMDALAPLEDEGEFLPVRLKGQRGSYFLFNSTTCRSYLDSKRTVFSATGPAREGQQIRKHAFWEERIGDECLFKLLEDGGINLYCVERTGDPFGGEFKALVEAKNLTGLRFEKAWSGGR